MMEESKTQIKKSESTRQIIKNPLAVKDLSEITRDESVAIKFIENQKSALKFSEKLLKKVKKDR